MRVDRARAAVADLVGATPEEIVFTASGSESNNLALKGLLAGAVEGRRRLVVSAIEHPSVLETARHLEGRGVPVTVVPVDERGLVDRRALRRSPGPGRGAALGDVGQQRDRDDPADRASSRSARTRAAPAFHCDAVQAAGKLPIDVDALGRRSVEPRRAQVPRAARGGRAVRAPAHAAGAAGARRPPGARRAAPAPRTCRRSSGWASPPRGRRTRWRMAWPRALGTRWASGCSPACSRRVPGSRLNGDRDLRVRSIVNLLVPGVDGEAVLHELDHAGITVSTGSACAAASPGPSHVLMALGLHARGGARQRAILAG